MKFSPFQTASHTAQDYRVATGHGGWDLERSFWSPCARHHLEVSNARKQKKCKTTTGTVCIGQNISHVLPELSLILEKSSASIFPRSWPWQFVLQFTDLQAVHCFRRKTIHFIYIFESSLFLVMREAEKPFQQKGFLQDAPGQSSSIFFWITISPIGHGLRVYIHLDNTHSPSVGLLLLLLLGLACSCDLLAVLASEMFPQNRHTFKKCWFIKTKMPSTIQRDF